MSKTTTAHAASDLRFVTLDESGEIAYFHSDSQSKPGTVNVTALDLATEDTFCFCKAAECGHTCWHVVYVAAAWRMVAHDLVAPRAERAEVVDRRGAHRSPPFADSAATHSAHASSVASVRVKLGSSFARASTAASSAASRSRGTRTCT
jgi:hypothetical protein